MMNLLPLCLLLTSLAAAGVWSPTPEQQKQRQGDDQNVIVKEGHRKIVVEYEHDGQPNTIVFISPDQHHIRKPDSIASAEGGISSATSSMVENVKEKIKEASSFLSNLGQGLSQSSKNDEIRESYYNVTHKKLICDALGKYKHKIASAMGKAKEMDSETAHEAIDKMKEVALEAKEEAKEQAREVGEAAGHTLGKSKETVSRKARKVEERVKEFVKDAKDITNTIGEDIARNVSDKVEMAKEEVVEKAKQTAEHAADKLKTDQSKKKLSQSHNKREVGRDAAKYVKSPGIMSCLMCVINLLGLATAYGMCVWITFISSYILFGVLPRQQFGIVQSKIYPMYFSAMVVSIGAALMGLLLGNTESLFSSTAEMFQGYYLLASLLMVFFNMLFLEPRATKVMFERIKMEKEEGRGREELTAEPNRASEWRQDADPAASTTTTTAPSLEGAEQEIIRIRIVRLNDKLKKLNTFSSFNILTLMALSWHLVYLGQRT
ncbi:uncharacterized protein LOC122316435 [Carya illinoinensis]|uniref:uncharacterized protein LOC122316435 n=1 Tax=Carya illinoinensis TaxID=32201 RepID=UPI001C71D401|nr:uncharacterized protein LOC122316435 [Carya illinoinensis]